LGWADFQLTDYAQIQKWWEIVMSAYLLVSLHSQNLHNMENKGINEWEHLSYAMSIYTQA
jgi:hypothetical protein